MATAAARRPIIATITTTRPELRRRDVDGDGPLPGRETFSGIAFVGGPMTGVSCVGGTPA